jgi:hypothetical protein
MSAGAIFETWLVGKILKSRLNAGPRTPLHYFRNKDQRKVKAEQESCATAG